MKNPLLILILAAGASAVVSCAPVDNLPAPPAADVAPAATADAPPAVTAPPARNGDSLRPRLEAAIEQARRRELQMDNGFWTVFHGILGLGPAVELVDPLTRRRVNALDYIADGGEVRGLRFLPTPDGLEVETRPGTFISQGHPDQFVAEMVEWDVSPDRKFVVAGKEHTFRDFLRQSKARASLTSGQELEWTLVIVSKHFGTDITWTNAAGETVRFVDLVRHELDAPLDDAACGGTHRLYGLTWAYHLHLQHGGRTEGIWKEVAERIALYKRKAREQRNPDGTFSTNFFRGRGNAPELPLRLSTTGHIFEWLALSATDAELREPWMRDAANALALLFLEIERSPMEGGTLYHAVHGLLLYYARVYGPEWLGPNAPHLIALPGGPPGAP